MRKTMRSANLLCRNRCPSYGAVFMANNHTRKECFERELFGLPYEYANFVMEIKIGMLLFLFDYQERNLYGVFEATSDGAMNIVPDAYKSTSTKKFPAQVRFKPFWHCDPLPELIFSDAIKKNYVGRSKFSLGLSRDQVGKLLFLFEKRMLKIPSFPVRESQHERSLIGKSVVVAHIDSLENSESFTDSAQESIPEKLGNLDASDHEIAAEDFIPLPSIEPEEIEEPSDAFLWGTNFIPLLSFAEVGETENEKQTDSDARNHVQGWEPNCSDPAGCSSVPERSIAKEGHKELDDSSDLQVQGLYSDYSKNRTSVFLRLSGIGKVVAEERRRHSKVDNLKGILEGLDERYKMWKCNRAVNDSKSRLGVFARLKSDVGMTGESKRPGVLADVKKPIDVAEETFHSLKRKSCCNLKIDEKDHDQIPGNQQKKRSRKHSGKKSKVIRTPTFFPNVPDLSEGSSVCTLSSA